MKILISGSSGMIGSALVEQAAALGHEVGRLLRSSSTGAPDIAWTPGRPLDSRSLAQFDAVIHLAGRNVGTRWTPDLKREIRASRVTGTRTIAEAVAESFAAVGRPKTLISVSAIGYYGSRGAEELSEQSTPGEGFLAEVCRAWEAASEPAREAGVRVVNPRIGVVLSARGGALKKMLPAFRFGVAGKVGSGEQYWSWITLRDVVDALLFALTNERLSGPVNLVAPVPVTNAQFTRMLGQVLHRPTILAVPASVVQLLFGEMGKETILASQRVKPEKLIEAGYSFCDAELSKALPDLLNR